MTAGGETVRRALFDGSRRPDVEAVSACLGKAAPLWEAAISLARKGSPRVVEAWHFAGPKIGWTLRLVEGARILAYLTPGEGDFRVGLVLGRKAVAAAREADLSKAAARIIDAAPAYAEGHGVRFQIASRADMRAFRELLAIKIPQGQPRRGKRA